MIDYLRSMCLVGYNVVLKFVFLTVGLNPLALMLNACYGCQWIFHYSEALHFIMSYCVSLCFANMMYDFVYGILMRQYFRILPLL